MTTGLDTHQSLVFIGSGEINVDLLDADGNRTGERFVGDAAAFNLTISETRQTVFSGTGPTAQKLIDKVTQRDFGATATLNDMSAENLALLLGGSVTTASDDAVAVTNEAIPGDGFGAAKQGRWYPLGRSDAKPLGVLGVKETGVLVNYAGTAAGAAAGTVAVKGTDWELDAEHGRLYVKSATLDGQYLAVDYTPKAATHELVSVPRSLKDIYAAVSYVELSDDGAGRGRHIYIPRCTVGASGDMAVANNRQSQQQINLTFGVIQPPAGDALYIDGKAA